MRGTLATRAVKEWVLQRHLKLLVAVMALLPNIHTPSRYHGQIAPAGIHHKTYGPGVQDSLPSCINDTVFHPLSGSKMKQCHSTPSKLVYFGPWDGVGPVRATNIHKLGDLDDNILCMDFAKEHLKNNGGNSPFISLFTSIPTLRSFLKAHDEAPHGTAKMVLCEIDAHKLKGIPLYRVRDIASVMGAVAAKPLPEFLALHVIPCEAVKSLSLSVLR